MENKLIGWIEGTLETAADYKELVIFTLNLDNKKLVTIPLTTIGSLGCSTTMNDLLKHLTTEKGYCKVGNKNDYSDLKYYICPLEFTSNKYEEIYNKILTHTLENSILVTEEEFTKNLKEKIEKNLSMNTKNNEIHKKEIQDKELIKKENVQDFIDSLTTVAGKMFDDVIKPTVKNTVEKVNKIQMEENNSEKKQNLSNEKEFIGYVVGNRYVKKCNDYVLFYIENDILKCHFCVFNYITKLMYLNQWSVLSRQCEVENNSVNFDENFLSNVYSSVKTYVLPMKKSISEYIEFLNNAKETTLSELNKTIKMKLQKTEHLEEVVDSKIADMKEETTTEKKSNMKRILGWIDEYPNIRTVFYKDDSSDVKLKTFTYDICTNQEISSSVHISNGIIYLNPDSSYRFQVIGMNSNEFIQDIKFLYSREINCEVDLNEFLDKIQLQVQYFDYNSLRVILEQKNISPFEIAKQLGIF